MSDPEDPPRTSQADGQSHIPASDQRESDSPMPATDSRTSGGLDSLSLAALLLPVPWYLWSTAVVYWTATLFVEAPWARTGLGLWLLCGVAMLWRPLEEVVARLALQLRYPIQSESETLAGAWTAVAESANAEDADYSLMIDDSDKVTASAGSGRVVGVTRPTLELPVARLEAALAHELGHHVNGYSVLRAVGLWYTLPARAATWLIMNFGRIMHGAPVVGCLVSGFFLLSVLGIILTSLIFDDVPVPLLGVALFFLAPVILAWFDRMGEKNADKVAARWGYGPALLEVLSEVHAKEQGSKRGASMLSGQPGVADRIRALERYLSRTSR